MYTKIQALEKTIFNLENDVYEYDWNGFNSCNCGILARTIMNGKSVYDAGVVEYGYGSGISGCIIRGIEHCRQTGLPLTLIAKSLLNTGFSPDDIVNLESLKDREILRRIGVQFISRNWKDKNQVIKYLKAWVEILKEEQQSQPHYENISPSLAVLPTDEVSDLVGKKELVTIKN